MNSLADFKRELAKPTTQIRMLVINGGEPRPNISGWRTVAKLQTSAVALRNSEGHESWLYFGKASDWSFTGKFATIKQDSFTATYEIEEVQ